MVATVPTASSAAGEGNIVLASTNKAGVKGDGASLVPSLSASGRDVAFHSTAANLHPEDGDEFVDIYVKDLATGEVALASTNAQGVKANADSKYAALSGDGTRVAFMSEATNLDPRDASSDQDIYVKDLATGELFLASTSDDGIKGDRNSFHVSISLGGGKVAFLSWSSNLDPADADGNADIYVKDLGTGDIVLASTSRTGRNSNSGSDYPSLSADGNRVAFESSATNLVRGDRNDHNDIYVKDLTTGDIVLASVSEEGVGGNGGSDQASLSAAGTRVAFESTATNLDPVDRDHLSDIYVKDLVSGDVEVTSRSTHGVKGNEESFSPSLSSEGVIVAFLSRSTNLDPRDPDVRPDVYVKDVVTGRLILASTSGDGVKGNSQSESPSVSSTGTTVGFLSWSTNLVRQDQDAIQDVYVKFLFSRRARTFVW